MKNKIMSTSILVIDQGSSGITLSLINEEGKFTKRRRIKLPAFIPFDGIAEYDPQEIADTVLAAASELAASESIAALGITDHRASSMIWERKTGRPAGNMISWQDIRTVPACLELQSQGLYLLPNQPATKLQFLLQQIDNPEEYCFGTPESWLVWNLTEGAVHITDATHAGLSGLVTLDGEGWDLEVLSILGIPEIVLPEIVDSLGFHGEASALPGSPPIAGIVGDQQSSLIGQGCIKRGMAKMTFGTSGVLDVCTGESRPEFELRGENGTFPIIALRQGGKNFWGIEAIMLSAGSTIDWAVEKMSLAESAADTERVVAESPALGEVKFVPALTGLGTPYWDFGARGTFLGIQLNTDKTQMIGAVLDGIANQGADMYIAAQKDFNSGGTGFECLRLDGGMSQNAVFTQSLADACETPIEISSEVESTSLGAAYLAGTAVGVWKDLEATVELYEPAKIVEPNPNSKIREGWSEAVGRARNWYPDLSSIKF